MLIFYFVPFNFLISKVKLIEQLEDHMSEQLEDHMSEQLEEQLEGLIDHHKQFERLKDHIDHPKH